MYTRKEHTYRFKVNNDTKSDVSLIIYYKKGEKQFISVQCFNYAKQRFVVSRNYIPEQEHFATELFEALVDMMMNSETYDHLTETIDNEIEKDVHG